MQVDVLRHKNFLIVFSTFLLHKTSYLFSETSKMTFFKKFHWFLFIYAAILKCILWTLFNGFFEVLLKAIFDTFSNMKFRVFDKFVCNFNYVFSQFWPKRELVSRHEMDKFPINMLSTVTSFWMKKRSINLIFSWKLPFQIMLWYEPFFNKLGEYA